MSNINIVALGVYRHVAASMETMFQGTPYHLAAIIDLKSQPEVFTYTAHNLGVLLHCLEPRPQVFITGLMISKDMTKEAADVWEKYLGDLKPKNPLLIKVSLHNSRNPSNGY